MDEVFTCTSCPKMLGKISVHKLWMAIRNRCKDINALSLETKGLLDEMAGKNASLYTYHADDKTSENSQTL